MRRLAAAAVVLVVGGCHPDPTCAPLKDWEREASCTAKLAEKCSTERDEFYDACIDREGALCDEATQSETDRCRR